MSADHLPVLARTLPFAAYMLFIAFPETVALLGERFALTPQDKQALYPLQIGLPVLLMVLFRKQYTELAAADLRSMRATLAALLCGIIVFLLWLPLDWIPFGAAPAEGFRPDLYTHPTQRAVMTLLRVTGATLVVPLFEELFWRSFLSRYLISRNFLAVPQGTFTAFSFAATTLLFGLEHTFLVAGIMAGAAYNLLYRFTKSTTQCVLAHAVTNGLLCAHVLATQSWHYW